MLSSSVFSVNLLNVVSLANLLLSLDPCLEEEGEGHLLPDSKRGENVITLIAPVVLLHIPEH